jgi:hypothetical protein
LAIRGIAIFIYTIVPIISLFNPNFKEAVLILLTAVVLNRQPSSTATASGAELPIVRTAYRKGLMKKGILATAFCKTNCKKTRGAYQKTSGA